MDTCQLLVPDISLRTTSRSSIHDVSSERSFQGQSSDVHPSQAAAEGETSQEQESSQTTGQSGTQQQQVEPEKSKSQSRSEEPAPIEEGSSINPAPIEPEKRKTPVFVGPQQGQDNDSSDEEPSKQMQVVAQVHASQDMLEAPRSASAHASASPSASASACHSGHASSRSKISCFYLAIF